MTSGVAEGLATPDTSDPPVHSLVQTFTVLLHYTVDQKINSVIYTQ